MDRDKKIIKTSIWGIVVNLILVAFKATIGLIVNSIAIILDAVNNLSDALSSIITIIGTKLARKEPDKKHPYGYGRIEYFASLVIALIVLTAGVTSFKESFEKILNPEVAEYSIASVVIIAVAVVVKFIFGRYVKNVGKQINSQSLIASGTDAFMDSILSFSTLVAAIISLIWHISLEGYLGIIISIVIFKSSIEILKDTLSLLIGGRVDVELTERIKEKINSFKEVEGCYDLILHNYGESNIIGSVHIQVDDDMTAKEIHKLSRMIQVSIYSEYGITLTIGIYAANTSDGEFAKIKTDLDNIVKKHTEIIQLHGFYADTDTSLISFDLIIDFKCKNPKKLRDNIVKEIKEKYPKYNYMAILDNDYSE